MIHDNFENSLIAMLLSGDHPDLAIVREQYAVAMVRSREQQDNLIRVCYMVPDDAPVTSIREFGLADVTFTLKGDSVSGTALISIQKGRLDYLECLSNKTLPEHLQVIRLDYGGMSSRNMDYVFRSFACAKEQQTGPHLIASGSHGDYLWFASGHELIDFMELCQEIVIGKFLTVTSMDSGVLKLDEKELSSGWESRGGISYSPMIHSIEDLPHLKHPDCRYHEWYVFEKPMDLGRRSDVHPMIVWPQKEAVVPFVNYNFRIHDPYHADFTDRFWSQLEWIKPESYIADGSSCLTFLTRNKQLFNAVMERAR